jgi:hypothetical protein
MISEVSNLWGKVGLEGVTVGHARANGESRLNQGFDLDGLEILTKKCQTSVGAEVVGQFFDNEVGLVYSHL